MDKMTTTTPDAPAVALLPCPFCGTNATLFAGAAHVFCQNSVTCGASISLPHHYNTEAEAIAAWNTRPARMDAAPGFGPCPTCRQYNPPIGDDELAEAHLHFQSMFSHRGDGIPTQYTFDERTRDMAQRLVAAARGRMDAGDEAVGRVVIPRAFFDFLMGTGEIEGIGFGDMNPNRRGAFWWRTLLTVAALAPEQIAGKAVQVTEAMIDAGSECYHETMGIVSTAYAVEGIFRAMLDALAPEQIAAGGAAGWPISAGRDAKDTWCVWTKGGRRPSFFHATQEGAEREAARLAEKTPGKKFIVMHVVSKFGVEPPANQDMPHA